MSLRVHPWFHVFLLCALAALGGCSSDQPMNPAFPVTIAEAREALKEMRENPKPLQRPVIVASGYFEPGIISRNIAVRLRRYTDPEAPIASVSFYWAFTFDDCREKLIEAVERHFPSNDPHETVEVDVIGFSMGGLVARHAASPRDDDGKRLKINRLFTLGTPHRGARLAPLAPLRFIDTRAKDMRAGSALLAALDSDLAEGRYEIIPYVRLNDTIVGEENASPPGREPWWVPNKFMSMSHNNAGADERILADIARRLRGEDPLTREPAVPVPSSAKDEG